MIPYVNKLACYSRHDRCEHVIPYHITHHIRFYKTMTITMTDPIQDTADEALTAKLSTTRMGYYTDSFLIYFQNNHSNGSGSSNYSNPNYSNILPIIRRGTHARVCCMDRAIAAALDHVQKHNGSSTSSKSILQVLALGAGKDTSYFRLRAGELWTTESYLRPRVRWYEVDQHDMIKFKQKRIRQFSLYNHNHIKSYNRNVANEEDDEHYLIGFNLQDPINLLIDDLIQNHNFDISTPTLILLECVQMYLPDRANRLMLSGLGCALKDAMLAIYDPMLLGEGDGFGRVMLRNLQRRKLIPIVYKVSSDGQSESDCDLPALLVVRDLSQQIEKLHSCGFSHVCGACDMLEAYQSRVLTIEQRNTAQRCEMLDELEEWALLMKHYSFIVVSNRKGGVFSSLTI